MAVPRGVTVWSIDERYLPVTNTGLFGFRRNEGYSCESHGLGKRTGYIPQSGRYDLQVNTVGDWNVSVTEPD